MGEGDIMQDDNLDFDIKIVPSVTEYVPSSPSDMHWFREHHLYINVTFATIEDVKSVWWRVMQWQGDVLPTLIKQGKVPDLRSRGPGRPPLPDKLCCECARLRDDEHWTYGQIGDRFGMPRQESAYSREGKVTRSRCRTAEEAVKRGRELRREGLCT